MQKKSYNYFFIILFILIAITIIVFTVKYFYKDKVKSSPDDILFEQTDEVDVYI